MLKSPTTETNKANLEVDRKDRVCLMYDTAMNRATLKASLLLHQL